MVPWKAIAHSGALKPIIETPVLSEMLNLAIAFAKFMES
jgi:hypothetical protein